MGLVAGAADRRAQHRSRGSSLILKPSNSLSTLAVILGILILIDGIFEIVGAESFGECIDSGGCWPAGVIAMLL